MRIAQARQLLMATDLPLKAVADRYQAKYQELPDHNFYKAYISMSLIKAVVEQNKSFDQQQFRASDGGIHDGLCFFRTEY